VPCQGCSEVPVRAHICGLVPASDVNWLAHVQPRAPRTFGGPRCRSGSGHSSLATWGGWPGLIGVLEGCRTIGVGVVRSDLIVCGPSVAPMWPQPVWSEVLGQGAAVTQVLGCDRTPAGPGVPSCAPPLQDRSPALLCHQPRAGATLVRGTFLANRRPAVETRVHQSGGPPTHAAPAHRADPRARPPPATGPWIDHHQHHQGGAYRTAFTLTAAPTSEGWL
jgi:hypothetical protein